MTGKSAPGPAGVARASARSRSRDQFNLPLFAAQRVRYALHFTCEHCSHFVEEGERCAHGYPNQQHRDAHYADEGADLVFCKEFELR